MSARREVLPLGTWVEASDTLVRIDRPRAPLPEPAPRSVFAEAFPQPPGYWTTPRAWVRHAERWEHAAAEPARGIIVGVRTLANGDVTWAGEDGSSFRVRETLQAYVIAYDLRRRHVLARVEDVTPTERSTT